jgi:3-carboxy-cis,cis-muconate cycloisomerase
VLADAGRLVARLADVAEVHRDDVMTGRTLTQPAVPITFGLKAAQWLTGVLDAVDRLAGLDLPVQCGGAAGTSAAVAEFTDPGAARTGLARQLGLADPGLPWHTRRGPLTAVADALVTLLDALGVVAGDVALLGRPEIAEVAEAGAGVSSTMPHKQNPVLSVLIRSAALQGPHLAAGLHIGAALMVDERPDGAWHAQWPLYRDLLTLALIATSQAADLADGLVVDPQMMRRRAQEQVGALLAEKHAAVPEGADPASYLGEAGRIVDAVVARARDSAGPGLALTVLAGDDACRDVLLVGAGLGTAASPHSCPMSMWWASTCRATVPALPRPGRSRRGAWPPRSGALPPGSPADGCGSRGCPSPERWRWSSQWIPVRSGGW